MTMPADARAVLSEVPDLTGVSLEELEQVTAAPVADRFAGNQEQQNPDDRQSQVDSALTQD